jgi:hypothetical protein
MTAPKENEALIARLREAAKKATPGPWEVYDGCSWRRIGTAATRDRPRYDDCAVVAPTKASDGHPDLDCSSGNDLDANLQYIALCSPDNIGSLLDRLDALSARIQELEGAVELYANEANWKLGGPCDPNSPNFAGVSFARSALGRNADG